MAGPFYADGTLATGDNNGTSWTHAWQGEAGLQTLLDTIAAGEIGYIRNTFTLTASLDIDQNSGTDDNPIRIIGCDAAGSEGGDPAVIDADSAAVNCLNVDDKDDWWIENVEFKNATGHNVNVSATADVNRWVWFRCVSHDAIGSGWAGAAAKRFGATIFLFCHSYGNDVSGFDAIWYSTMFACTAVGNGNYGFNIANAVGVTACVAASNTWRGFQAVGQGAVLIGCVGDGNVMEGAQITTGVSGAIGCRWTDNGGVGDYGLEASTVTIVDLYNFYLDNDNPTGGSTIFSNDKGATTQITAGTEGYIAADNWGCTTAATGNPSEIDVDGTIALFLTRGLPSEQAGGGGGLLVHPGMAGGMRG